MPHPCFIVDAFAERPFAGNPAGVVLLDGPAADGWMQFVAAELRHSETAFVGPFAGGARPLRWFTPAVEVDLCGHATLAAAHVLWSEGHAAHEAVLEFETRSGRLTCRRDADGAIELDFPRDDPARVAAPPQALLDGCGVEPIEVLRGRFDYLVVAESAEAVRNARPDLRALASLEVRGVCITAPGGGEVDFVSRFFAPAVGIDEDPVTGSAHCMLTPYWSARLDRAELRAEQWSARGGRLRAQLADARVLIAGRAVTVLRGELG